MQFVTDNVDLDATVMDGPATRGCPNWATPTSRVAKARGEDIDRLLPGVHRIASLVKRWLLSTHQGAVKTDHLDDYLREFSFRFNRRHSRARGMLFYRVL